ncbi:hypothetical protein FA95DRAFT_1565600 [Auriscalpium vulgare]|uniref:Uncharacterized protein n=1 Tax=Auriscalpium vulgare TaxID=40419 RepID=A0ACB8RB09_9AGAM|nr:hypothetical protein FA95DRAFT_1565600 [Auriscalpium vulgare]
MAWLGSQRVDRIVLGVYFLRTLSFVLHRLPVARNLPVRSYSCLRLNDISHFYATASSADSL